MPVPDREEAQRLAGLFLDALDFGPLHFADTPAIDADQMVMMRPLKLNFEFGLSARRSHTLGQTAFFEHLERSEDGDFPDAFAFESHVDLIHRDMLLGMQKKIHNLLALFGQPESLVSQIFLEDLMNPRGIAFAPGGPGWKKDKFFGDGSHLLIEIDFQYSILGRWA